jgi:pilus assembly protein CpaF
MNLLERMEKKSIAENNVSTEVIENENAVAFTEQISAGKIDEFIDVKETVHREVATQLAKQDNPSKEDVRKLIEEFIEENYPEISRLDKGTIVNSVLNEINGLGPLEELLNDETVSEIMVNGPKQIYVERKGKLVLANVTFQDEEHVRRIIDRIVSPLGRRIDDSNPMVDARLADGSRVNAIIPPLALCGSTITIRKFSDTPLTIGNLISFGSLSSDMAGFLEACVRGKINILVSGGTGSGKTTLLNVLSAFIPHDERIVTIEDAAELKLMQDHVVSLESRPANLEGKGAITIRDLVRNALRMRPDRIVVGEVRGGETLDMLQAMNTGHDGSLTTAHANSPRDALARIETMVMMSGMELPVTAIRQQASGALDLIIQQARLKDGSRKVTSICEVSGMEGDIITTQEIFRFVIDGYDSGNKITGHFESTGVVPKCCEKIIANGAKVNKKWFLQDA